MLQRDVPARAAFRWRFQHHELVRLAYELLKFGTRPFARSSRAAERWQEALEPGWAARWLGEGSVCRWRSLRSAAPRGNATRSCWEGSAELLPAVCPHCLHLRVCVLLGWFICKPGVHERNGKPTHTLTFIRNDKMSFGVQLKMQPAFQCL